MTSLTGIVATQKSQWVSFNDDAQLQGAVKEEEQSRLPGTSTLHKTLQAKQHRPAKTEGLFSPSVDEASTDHADVAPNPMKSDAVSWVQFEETPSAVPLATFTTASDSRPPARGSARFPRLSAQGSLEARYEDSSASAGTSYTEPSIPHTEDAASENTSGTGSAASTRTHMAPPADAPFAAGDDDAVAGPSSVGTPPPKMRRRDTQRPVHITPPQMRISEVLEKPPSQLLASSASMSPRSPHLQDEPLEPASSVDPDRYSQDTFILNLTAIPPSASGTPPQDTRAQLRTPPWQGTPPQAAFSSPTTPQQQTTVEHFIIQTLQAMHQQTNQALENQSQFLQNLTQLPRMTRNMTRYNREITRLNNNFELYRVENNRVLEAIQQQNAILLRHHQTFTQALQQSQELMASNMQALTTALRDITVIMTNMSQQISRMQPTTSETTSASITPSQTPTTSPQRRTRRQERGKAPAKTSSSSAKK